MTTKKYYDDDPIYTISTKEDLRVARNNISKQIGDIYRKACVSGMTTQMLLDLALLKNKYEGAEPENRKMMTYAKPRHTRVDDKLQPTHIEPIPEGVELKTKVRPHFDSINEHHTITRINERKAKTKCII